MKISIIVNGTRGDVQPMIALATGLKKNGHKIIICAPPENEDLVKSHDCQFVAFGPNYKELFKNNLKIKGGATLRPSLKNMKRDTENQIKLLPEMLKGSDLLLGVGFVLGVHTAADVLKVPYRFVIFYPSILGASKNDAFIFRLLFGFGRSMTNMAIKSFINKKRKELDLQPINDVWQNWMGDNVIVACDKELNQVKEGVIFNFTQTGYMILPSKIALPENIENFLNHGKPPVYIGFGSNPISSPEKFGQIFSEVSKATNHRLIISKGWAEFTDESTSDILYVDEMPSEILFPRLAAIVYHGGTGTMAAAARAGIPQIAFPFMADQFDNRKQIVKLGLGPNACDFKKITSNSISEAINACLSNENYKQKVLEISQKLKNSNGLELTLSLIEKELKR